jgi:hypothetical protein
MNTLLAQFAISTHSALIEHNALVPLFNSSERDSGIPIALVERATCDKACMPYMGTYAEASSCVEASYLVDLGLHQAFELETDFVQTCVADDDGDDVHTHKVVVVVQSVVEHIHKAVVVGVHSVVVTLEFLVKKNHLKNLNHLIPTHALFQALVFALALALVLPSALALA